MAQPAWKQAREAQYRTAILDAAEAVFAERGFEGARMKPIAERAGLSVGTIYGVFANKADLYTLTLSRRLDEVQQHAAAAAAEGAGPLDRLERGIRAYVAFMLAHPSFLRLHLAAHAWGLDPGATYRSDEQVAGWRDGLALLAQVMEHAIADGSLVPGDPVLMARSLVAIQQVHLGRWVEQGMTQPASEVADALQRTFRLMFCTDRSSA